ncbi:alpha-L-rhamnosidase [Rhizodiscina lignyota]|uniref:Alpha-L-rhamnosidase n=1 Tax=Rhizodiscina lignyota TaxID=1504668 RepID=A0A9P4IDJ9_9PEZI|nr:alpha-L-rhamnosidase [Rhizodiscina lignyota]
MATKYNQYILMPSSRTLSLVTVFNSTGTVSGASSVTGGKSGSLTFDGISSVTFDYEKNIAGVVSVEVTKSSGSDQRIGVTFSESSEWISNEHSDTTGNVGFDDMVFIDTPSAGNFSLPRQLGRGAFRYVTLVHNSSGTVKISKVNTQFIAMPHYAEEALQNYTGYFHCDDELLNRIWYAGAYTLNLDTIDPKNGDALIAVFNNTPGVQVPIGTWYYNYTITNGTSALVDGAKRDTLVWPGDMAIAVPSTVVSTYDMITVRNDLDSLFALQNTTTGRLPYAGRGFPVDQQSWTYHMYSLLGAANYFIYTGDSQWLSSMWNKYKFGLNFTLNKIDDSGMMYVDPKVASADWLRAGMGAHNIEANAILYHTINLSIQLATALNDTAPIPSWQKYANGIKTAANNRLWNETMGMYHDNDTSSLAPQDGNSWAVVANLTLNSSQIASISSGLQARWGSYGAPAPEASQNKTAVSPFISGFELQAHFLAENASRALELMRLEWGFMLNDPRMTNSTLIEGYSSDGSIHYPPYSTDSRISHAHGWSTGPTSALTFYVAGIQLLSPVGKTWIIAPSLGNLTTVDAGFSTSLGLFSATTNLTSDGGISMEFEAPAGTSGSVNVPHPGCSGLLTLQCQQGGGPSAQFDVVAQEGVGRFVIEGLTGGRYTLNHTCS